MFVDETGAATNMTRRYGRGPRGQRVDGPVPHGHWKSTTFVGGLTARGFIAVTLSTMPDGRTTTYALTAARAKGSARLAA